MAFDDSCRVLRVFIGATETANMIRSSFLLLIICFSFISCNPGKVTVGSEKLASDGLKATAGNCELSPGTEAYNDPQNIQDLLKYINGLPKPLELDCFLQKLKRPLYVNATSSQDSVQEADGERSPRIFIFKNKLIISIVPSGSGSEILEFSEMTSSSRSIKGELTLPIYAKVMPPEPYIRINNGDKTSCSGCHKDEAFEHFSEGGAKVFSSIAFKPRSSQAVSLSSMHREHYLCNVAGSETKRCKILNGLFSHGEVLHQDFPSGFVEMLSVFGPN